MQECMADGWGRQGQGAGIQLGVPQHGALRQTSAFPSEARVRSGFSSTSLTEVRQTTGLLFCTDDRLVRRISVSGTILRTHFLVAGEATCGETLPGRSGFRVTGGVTSHTSTSESERVSVTRHTTRFSQR